MVAYMDYYLKHKKPVIAGTILLAAVLCFIYYFFNPVAVSAFYVKQQDYVPTLLLSGEVISEFDTALSTQNTAIVSECPFKKGDTVKKGQVVVKLDDRQALIARDQARQEVEMTQARIVRTGTVDLQAAILTSVQADLEAQQAQRHDERIDILAGANAVSLQEVEQADQDLKLALEKARSAKAALEALQPRGVDLQILQHELLQRRLALADKELVLEQHKLLAPHDGVILELYAQPGELLQAGSKAALLASTRQNRIKIQPDQRYNALMAINNQAQVWLPSDARSKWPATVVFVEPSGNADQGSFTAELSLEQNVPELYPGRLVSVQVFGSPIIQGIIIPELYLSAYEGKTGVWLAGKQGCHFAELQLGIRTPDGIVVLNGLKEGDIVLKAGKYKEGLRVAPKIKGFDDNAE